MSRRKQVNADILTDVPLLEEGQSFVIIQPSEGTDRTKVQGDIAAVLFPDHIKSYKQEGIWPFDEQATANGGQQQDGEDGSSDGEESDDSLFVNTNRPVLEESESESESDEDSDDDDDKDEDEEEKATISS
ncbi:hypothetical protein DFQ27_006634 [Actinomortierella ambigua]|uniref:Uncharacterized protein n=1 Tax=Actinomortierella ambigua TaxID=1343610 RepID=A0A9P6PYH1_9FUNG|nr:hypothetical protein DFQ27_006634 [Actinomortierella ambigua]